MLDIEAINTFYGPSHILNDVSLKINQGEVVCLMGRNGVGKSTTMKSVIRILTPKTGRVVFEGRDIAGMRPFQVARLGIGYIPEDRRIFGNLTVRDNLEIAKRRSQENKWSLDRIFSLFPKLDLLQKHRGLQLSGGEQQMLTIARTLMAGPKILLLDEPSEGLAPVVVQQLGDFLRELKKEITILVAEQNVNFALSLSDRVYIMDKGQIIFECDSESLRNDKELQRKYCAL
jgi:branched-chain amino acid transport system ATP-binding protein